MAGSTLILDIDEQGINALLVKETFQGVAIVDKCHVLLNELPSLEQSEEQEELNFFFGSLNLISKKINLKDCSTATLFIPSSIVSYRNTILPFKSKNKLKQVLNYELTSLLPLNNANYLSDFTLTDISLSESQNFIFSASVPEHFIQNYFNSLDHFGIKPELITIKGYVKADWLAKKDDSSKILFLDIGTGENTLTFVINKKVTAIRSLRSSISTSELAQEIFNTYLGFKQKTRYDLIFDKIIITSGSKADQKTCDILLDVLQTRFQCQAEYKSVEKDLLLFLFKEKKNFLNLCQAKYKSDSFIKTNINKIITTGVIAAFVLILLFFNIYFEISSLEKKLSLYKDAQVKIFKQTFPEQKKIVDPFMQMRAMISASQGDKNRQGSNSLAKKGIRSVDLLFELSEKIPDDVDIIVSRLLFNDNRLIFSGSTDNFNNIDKIKTSLEKSSIFPDVNISKATADKKDGKVLFQFVIKF